MKKLIAIVGLSFLFMNFTNLDNVQLNKGLISPKCDDTAYNVMNQAFNAGYSDEDVFWFMNVAYALCEGYSTEDINL